MNSIGNAGQIEVNVVEQLAIINNGEISTSTFAEGNAGAITINAETLMIDGQGISSGVFSIADRNSIGNAGQIEVNVVEQLAIINNGEISTSTFAEGNAGTVIVNANTLTIDGEGDFAGIFSATSSESSGNAGQVDVNIDNQISIINSGEISTSTESMGNAGIINVSAGQLSIFNQGEISSSTVADGAAGAVTINTQELLIDGQSSGVFSIADANSQGQAGNIIISAEQLSLNNNGVISIESNPTLNTATLAGIQTTQININANNIQLNSGATINASSAGNVPASAININGTNLLVLNNATITTSANNADGGDITIGGGVTALFDSLITTSVLGQGDGGDITLNAEILLLNGGFIQANTAGAAAQGGDKYPRKINLTF